MARKLPPWLEALRREIRLISYVNLSSFDSFQDSLRMIWLVRNVRNHTMLSPRRLKTLYKLAGKINEKRVPGDIVECGVCNGGSAAIMASVAMRGNVERDIWLFDSFQGLPKPGARDGERAERYEGMCLGDSTKVEQLFEDLAIPRSRVHIVKGWFDETLAQAPVSTIALLHIDADWYASVKVCLERFYDKVEHGGFVILDDYGCWEGCRAAVEEFRVERGVKVNLHQIDYTAHYFEKDV